MSIQCRGHHALTVSMAWDGGQQLRREHSNAMTAQPRVGPESRGLAIPYDTSDGYLEESFSHNAHGCTSSVLLSHNHRKRRALPSKSKSITPNPRPPRGGSAELSSRPQGICHLVQPQCPSKEKADPPKNSRNDWVIPTSLFC
jgi:hypothetical protein